MLQLMFAAYLEHWLESRAEGEWDLANYKTLEEEVHHHAHGKLQRKGLVKRACDWDQQ